MAARGHSKTNVWAGAFGRGVVCVILIILLARDSMEIHFVELQKQKPMY